MREDDYVADENSFRISGKGSEVGQKWNKSCYYHRYRKIESEWKYVSDGELPDHDNAVLVGIVGESIQEYGIYVKEYKKWFNCGIEINVYCWKEIEQLPPVR